MRRYLVVALPILLLGAALYVIGSAGSPGHAKSTPQLLPPAQQAATTRTKTATVPQTTAVPHATMMPHTTAVPQTTVPHTTTVITAKRTNCRWRRYRDGAIGADPSCAPGKLDPAMNGNTAQTVCNRAWVAEASRLQPSQTTLDKLLIEYQLPGNPVTYALVRVIPVEDGGSATSPLNLYPLPLNGFGGHQTRTVVANQLHDEICAHKITIAQAAKTLEGDWLSKGLPNSD